MTSANLEAKIVPMLTQSSLSGKSSSSCTGETVSYVQSRRKRVSSEPTQSESDYELPAKLARYTGGDSESGLLTESAEKNGNMHDVAQHVELKHSDDEDDNDEMDDEDTADGDFGDTNAEQRVYPCPMTSSGGRPRKHPAQPPKYLCHYCGRGCQKPSVLAKHIRAHTNERPYPCELCGFAFKTKSNLYKHSKSKTHHDKLNSVLQSRRLGTLAECSAVLPPVHVTTDFRSTDSASPTSDNQQQRHRSSSLCSPSDSAPVDSSDQNLSTSPWVANRAMKNETPNGSHENSTVNPHSCADAQEASVSAPVTVAVAIPMTVQSTVNQRVAAQSELSPGHRNFKGVNNMQKRLDVGAVKAKLRSLIEQKHSVGKSANHDETQTQSGTSQQLVSTTNSDSNSPMSLASQNESLLLNESISRTHKLDIVPTDEARSCRENLQRPVSVPTDTKAGDLTRQNRSSGKSPLQTLMRDHTTPTLQTTLCSTWSILKKPPICSLIDGIADERLNSSTSKQPGDSADVESSSDRHERNSLSSISISGDKPPMKPSRMDVLIEATDLVDASQTGNVAFDTARLANVSGSTFVPSSLDLLAAAAEVASRLDNIVVSRVPSPAEHIDVVNSSLALLASKSQTTNTQNASAASSNVSQLLAEPRKYMCHLCSKPFPKEHTLLLHLKVHAIEAPYRCGVCRVSYGKLSRLKRHQQAKGHFAQASTSATIVPAGISTNKSQSTSASKSAELLQTGNNSRLAIHEQAKSFNEPQLTNTQSADNSGAEKATIKSLSTKLSVEEKSCKSSTGGTPLEVPLTTKFADKHRNADVFSNNEKAEGVNQTRETERPVKEEPVKSAIPAIPITSASNSLTAVSSVDYSMPQNLDSKIVFLGGPRVGVPVGLPNGLFATFALPFNGYTLLPTHGGLYLAAQPQPQPTALSVNSLGNPAQVILPPNNTQSSLVSVTASVPTTEVNNHSVELTSKSDAVTETNSDKDAAELEGGACSARPFRCQTCNRGFRVQGHLNKHMRSKIHLENVASLDTKATS